jgi:hypothetical protein
MDSQNASISQYEGSQVQESLDSEQLRVYYEGEELFYLKP